MGLFYGQHYIRNNKNDHNGMHFHSSSCMYNVLCGGFEKHLREGVNRYDMYNSRGLSLMAGGMCKFPLSHTFNIFFVF